jgi:DNA-3-methyladenine glycosylase II
MPRHPYRLALSKLALVDPHIAAALAEIGLPAPRDRPMGFASLARIIVGQQVSTASARAMWEKLTAGFDPFTPHSILSLTADELRARGMSRQKAAYLLGLALDIVEGRLDLDRIQKLEDEAAIAELTKVKGFGRWSAEIYLLFSLRRPDVFPSGDLALAVAMQRLKGLRQRPTPERLIKLVEPWRPHRGAAAVFLWHFHHNAPFDAREK